MIIGDILKKNMASVINVMTFEEKLALKNEFDGNLQMGAKTFNEKTGRDKHLANRKKNTDNYIDIVTGSIPPEITKDRSCPLCDEDDYEYLFIKDGFKHVRCKSCTMVYVTPTLKEEKTHSFYFNEDSYNQVLMNKLQLEMDEKRFNYSLDIIDSLLENRGQIIDIGAGPGFFLEQAIKRGWKATAVELNQFSVHKLKSLDVKIINKPLNQVTIEQDKYDCATLWAVLEHIIKPNEFLQGIYKLLKTEGVLGLIVPNFDSLAVRILQKNCATFGGESHVNHFNDLTLTTMLRNNGFEKIQIESIFTEINTIQNYLSFNDPYLGIPTYFLDVLTPEYIHKNLLGYAIMAFFKKV